MNQLYKKGVKYAFITAVISGLAVFINKFGVTVWETASIYTTAKNLIAALLLTGLLIAFKKLPELKRLSAESWRNLILIGIIGGSVPFLLFFQSLKMIPAVQAAFIHKTLFLWVAVLSYPFLKEKLSKVQLFALAILFLGVFMFSVPLKFSLQTGSIMALVATILWAIENVLAKITLKDVSSMTLAWARMFFGSIILLGYLAITGNLAGIIPQTAQQIGITFVVGAVLFGYVVSWYSALKYAPATVVASVLVLAAPITAILNSIFVTHNFAATNILPIFIMLAGALLLSKILQKFSTKILLREVQT
jgi:drug/metabolite transporter (DMT)-like permease